MNYSVYLFDFDYTLANSERGIVTCYRHVLERHGYTGVSDYDICRTIGHTLINSFEMLSGVKDRAVLEQYRQEYGKKADEVMVDNTFLYPPVIQMLQALKARGCKTGIISTKLRFRIMGTLERYNIVDLVDIIIGGEDVAAPKPDPEGVCIAMERLGADKSDVLYIGDSLVDAETAKNAGVDFAAVLTGATTAREFDGFPCVRIMSELGELA